MRDRAFLLRRAFAVSVCAGLLIFVTGLIEEASAAVQKSPVLFSASASSTRAIALESMTLRAEPFQLTSDGYFNAADSRTRIALFGTDFDFLQGEGANALSADAQDAAGTMYPLNVEYVGTVPNFDGVYMVIVRLNDSMPVNVGDVLVRLRLHGMSSNRVRLAIGQIGGGPPDDPGAVGTPAPATPPGAASALTIAQYQAQYNDPNFPGDADIIRFLEQSSWGPKGDASDFNRVRLIGIPAYLDEQFNTAASGYPNLTFPLDDQAQQCPTGSPPECGRDNFTMYPIQRTFFTNALTGQDQLRQRVAFALHQILVISGRDINRPAWMTPYLQILDRSAFGNYRTLLQEITLNPGMGEYLDMRRNTTTSPNENFAREILQLFSIGVNELNLDGTPKLDAQGKPLPSYTQTTVNEFTRILTGWTFAGQIAQGITNYRDPMVARANNGGHDQGSKMLLNGLVTQPNQGTVADLNTALDNIFNHPNVGPFIGKQLIQHLVTSNPSPAYVERVATVFNNNRLNPAQMREVVRAILLDPEARGNSKTDPGYGHLREPAQLINNVLRAFDAKSFDKSSTSDGVLASRSVDRDHPNAMDQPTFLPPTVFSYYQPDYVVPGTGILGPSFFILSTTTTLRRANFVNYMLYTGIAASNPPTATSDRPRGTSLDLAALEAMASNPDQLLDRLNLLNLHGTLSDSMRTSIRNAMTAIPTSDANFARKRAQVAVYLVTTSSQYEVQR